jgi:guanine nucleotide-binding protein G(i) subunit alpha
VLTNFSTFGNLERFMKTDYQPTDMDIIVSRQKTTGVTEVKAQFQQKNLIMIDVGGQRSERKKWIHCFENVNAIIFVASLTSYHQVLIEDEKTSRIAEALNLFEFVLECKWFTNTLIILFMNKKDLFQKALTLNPLEDYFPDYQHGSEYKKARKHILQLFLQKNKNKRLIYPFFTCATDTKNVGIIIDAVNESIITNSLRAVSLIE